MRTEHARILVECRARHYAITVAAEPPDWKPYEVREHFDGVEHGPRYLPGEWFGRLSDAERQRYMRAVYDLDAEGLLVAFKTEGGRLQRIKLTPAGETKAAELTASTEAVVDAP